MTVGVVVGNPKLRSRTYAAAVHVAAELAGADPQVVIDVVDLGSGLLSWSDQGVAEAVAAVRSVDLLVVASPTFKATYTGLLKLFLDQVPGGGLSGVVAVPLMLGAGAAHALAPELLLKPVLVELGASTPTKALYLLDSDWQSPSALTDWLPGARDTLRRAGVIKAAPRPQPEVAADARGGRR